MKYIRNFEMKLNSKEPIEALMAEYRRMEEYMGKIPCGCSDDQSGSDSLVTVSTVHQSLYELLGSAMASFKLNELDRNRRKKILHNIESLKNWISKDVDFDHTKSYETIKDLKKAARALELLAGDVYILKFGKKLVNFINF